MPLSSVSGVDLFNGDCLDVLRRLPENSIDACVTDPPYHFTSIVQRFGKQGSAPAQFGTDGAFARASRGFMGKEWDGGDIAFRPETWALVWRVLKPGAHLVAFGAPKNYHRLACAIEDAGFEIRDSLMWVFGSGFPKSHNLEGGRGTALKPAYEPIVLARKPLGEGTVAANVLRWGTGALNIDATRVATDDKLGGGGEKAETSGKFTNEGWRRPWMDDANALERQAAKVRANVQKAEALGRWPANLCHDGSQGVLDLFPQTKSGNVKPYAKKTRQLNCYGKQPETSTFERDGDEGSAARFFYCAKASKQDRAGSKHPTVKPINLMRWLVRMVTPTGGAVLDPFAGSGTTGQAAVIEGFKVTLIEREAEYLADIKARLNLGYGDDNDQGLRKASQWQAQTEAGKVSGAA